MNETLFAVGIVVFLLTVYGTVMIGSYQLRTARLDQQRREERTRSGSAGGAETADGPHSDAG